MTITDADVTFFNAYDFVGFGPFAFTAPIERVQVDAFVGGTFTATGDDVERTGGDWVTGTPGTALTLPDGVAAADVQGLRFTFTKADGTIWENPSTPTQTVVLQVQRREELRSGGAVRSDLAGLEPNPGEEDPGVSTDTIQGQNWAADTVNGERLTGRDDATDDILYRHANNAVEVTKAPTGAQAPGANIPYTLTFTNTGDVPITNPVITDTWASDADGPLLVFDPDRAGAGDGYTYTLSGDAPDPENGSPMPEVPDEVSVDETDSSITFTFPEGTVLEVGQSYVITTPLQFRPGLPGNTQVTNTTGITADRAWDECEQTLAENGECQDSTTVYPTRAGALRGVKSVKAVDDELGVVDTLNTGCEADDDGFYVGGCVPVTKPGEDNIWRMTFTNTGNLPQDYVYAIDRLPTPGDTGAIVPLDRGSQWTPTPKSLEFAAVTKGSVREMRVYGTTEDEICTDDLNDPDGCPDGAWTLIGTITDVGGSVDISADTTALQIQTDFADGGLFQPTGTLSVDLTTTAPALNPTDPETGERLAQPIAWNTVAAAAETNDAGATALVPMSEGNKVGATLATGPLGIEKIIDGPAADYAPDSFTMNVSCTSAGEDVPLADDEATLTVTPPEVSRIENLPWGSECTVTEAAGSGASTIVVDDDVTVGRDSDPLATVTVTNTYAYASLVITKDVQGSAQDAEGNPLPYGPFTFDVACTYLGEPVTAAEPMTVEISSGESATLTQLPAGASCTATETDDGGASSTTSTGTAGDDEPITGDTTIGPLELAADGENALPTNTVAFTNTFATGSVVITKVVTGPGAEAYEVGPFTVHLTCVDAENPDRTVYEADHQLTTDDLTWTVENLYVDSTCEVTEPATGGATTSVVSPEGQFPVTAESGEAPVAVTVTNTFQLGGLRLIKKIAGDESQVGDDTAFAFEVACQLVVDGDVQDVELPDGGVVKLSKSQGLVAELDDLPTGASCTVTETDNGGADESVLAPGEVTIGDGTTVDVVATNTFDAPPSEPPSDDDEGSSSGGGDLASTGGPSVIFGAVGVLLLIAGGTLIAALPSTELRPAGVAIGQRPGPRR